MDINSAIITMKAYGELDDRVKKFSKSLEDVIIRPRFDLKVGTLPSIDIQGVSYAIPRAGYGLLIISEHSSDFNDPYRPHYQVPTL
jgi:hypothetical protein